LAVSYSVSFIAENYGFGNGTSAVTYVGNRLNISCSTGTLTAKLQSYYSPTLINAVASTDPNLVFESIVLLSSSEPSRAPTLSPTFPPTSNSVSFPPTLLPSSCSPLLSSISQTESPSIKYVKFHICFRIQFI